MSNWSVKCGGALYLCSVSHSISPVPPWCCAFQPLPLPLNHCCAHRVHRAPLCFCRERQVAGCSKTLFTTWFGLSGVCFFCYPQHSCSELDFRATLIRLKHLRIWDTLKGSYSRSDVTFEWCHVPLECCSPPWLLQRWCFSPYSRLNKGQYLFIVGHLQP